MRTCIVRTDEKDEKKTYTYQILFYIGTEQ